MILKENKYVKYGLFNSIAMLIPGLLIIILPLMLEDLFSFLLLIPIIIILGTIILFVFAIRKEGEGKYIIAGISWIIIGVQVSIDGILVTFVILPVMINFIILPFIYASIPFWTMGILMLVARKHPFYYDTLTDYMKELAYTIGLVLFAFLIGCGAIINTMFLGIQNLLLVNYSTLLIWGVLFLIILIISIIRFNKDKNKAKLATILVVSAVSFGLQIVGLFIPIQNLKIAIIVINCIIAIFTSFVILIFGLKERLSKINVNKEIIREYPAKYEELISEEYYYEGINKEKLKTEE
ncbi:MAG: hypothetical protein ACFFDW_17125 [Candidatus Thorarchaeota archaeon]